MSATKKTYDLIAQKLHERWDPNASVAHREGFIAAYVAVSNALLADNPRFNGDYFNAAVFGADEAIGNEARTGVLKPARAREAVV